MRQRLLPLAVAVLAAVGGCAGPAATTSSSSGAPTTTPESPGTLAQAHYMLGPSTPATDFSIRQDFAVARDKMNLTVQITITLGAAINMVATGACEHMYTPAIPVGTTVSYNCLEPAGNKTIVFRQEGPRIEFDLLITAR